MHLLGRCLARAPSFLSRRAARRGMRGMSVAPSVVQENERPENDDLPSDSYLYPEWLVGQPDLKGYKFLDATWYMPSDLRVREEGLNARAEFERAHLPGAQFFDITEISSGGSHAWPSLQIFSEKMAELGISPDDRIVVYDQDGMFSAARAWYMLKSFGAKQVGILDGGIKLWEFRESQRKSGKLLSNPFVTESGPAQVPCTDNIKAGAGGWRLSPGAVVSYDDVRENYLTWEKSRVKYPDLRGIEHVWHNPRDISLVVDARSYQRYKTQPDGAEKPPCKPGHIPGSVNLPFHDILYYDEVVDAYRMYEPKYLSSIFRKTGVYVGDKYAHVIGSCGSGVTACVLLYGLHRCGHTNMSLYDGSWSEYGVRAPAEDIETLWSGSNVRLDRLAREREEYGYLLEDARKDFDTPEPTVM